MALDLGTRHNRVIPPQPIARNRNSAASEPARAGLRRLHRQRRSTPPVRRARIGRSDRNRLKSSAICSADPYRCAGSLAIAFSTIVSRSRGMSGSILYGAIGDSCATTLSNLARFGSSNSGRSVSSS